MSGRVWKTSPNEREITVGFLDGRRILITGARNKWSIAWHTAEAAMREGAAVAHSVFSERERDDVLKLHRNADLPEPAVFLCDATKQEEVDAMMAGVGAHFGGQLDGLLHSMAFSKKEELKGEFLPTSQDGFALAMDASVYTLLTLSRAARPLMDAAGGGSIVTLTYYGAEKVVPGYNVMGVAKAALEASVRYLAFDLGPQNIRVNAVSAGAIKTLAASGISGLNDMLRYTAERAPLKRGVGADEVGDTCAFLLSSLSRGITGETIYVDSGYHIVGM